MNDAKQVADLVCTFLRILDKLERATEQPVGWHDIQDARASCGRVMLVAERMQSDEDS
jgi:hypothetical protein